MLAFGIWQNRFRFVRFSSSSGQSHGGGNSCGRRSCGCCPSSCSCCSNSSSSCRGGCCCRFCSCGSSLSFATLCWGCLRFCSLSRSLGSIGGSVGGSLGSSVGGSLGSSLSGIGSFCSAFSWCLCCFFSGLCCFAITITITISIPISTILKVLAANSDPCCYWLCHVPKVNRMFWSCLEK